MILVEMETRRTKLRDLKVVLQASSPLAWMASGLHLPGKLEGRVGKPCAEGFVRILLGEGGASLPGFLSVRRTAHVAPEGSLKP